MAYVNKTIATLLLMTFGACAETGTVWDLDNLQKQRVLYEAKAALNKAKADAEGRDYGSGMAMAPGSPYSTSHVAGIQTPATALLPQLVKINGKKAVISLSEGNTTTVSPGHMLPGGTWQVLSIGLSGVKIKNISTQRTQVLN
ncbi:type IV pilus biogenesis protein PilP [Xenorhabdus budapestensis]|uniref:Type IV pilus biogenesis/secretion protein PilP n=1 Tax=Xenorhabdus budapestensis TaxID=290110 RepID=A0A2D0IT12_XENBU|nr:type IV pilus biogenesis protein PilP [Xenorhabdus budapestensis]PHM25036.1 type IV pilus biogenesis/secretion protein PilP [Xenorhabdus budapestensis]